MPAERTSAATTECTTNNPLGLPQGFAEFVHHDAQRVSDSEGRVAYGGTAVLGDSTAGAGFSIGSGQPVDSVGIPLPADGSRHDLIVGGTVRANNMHLVSSGARYGELDAVSSPPISSADSTPIDFDSQFRILRAKSAYWAKLPTTGTVTHTTGRHVVTMVGDDADLNVFDHR